MSHTPIRVGIVGGGLGGLAAAIAIARAGAEVTVLEAAAELGEIGAGILIYPNASRFLIRWGVDEIIGDNLLQPDETNTWASGPDLKLISRVDAKQVSKVAGFPWWIVRRDHLHAGLALSARKHGVSVITNARVQSVETLQGSPVTLTTVSNKSYTFDLVIGADGVKPAIRGYLFPSVQPVPYAAAVAYRHTLNVAIVYSEIPEAGFLIRNSFNMWTGPHGYVVTYPLSGGTELNVTICFYTKAGCTTTIVENANLDELQEQLKEYPTLIQKMWALAPGSNRWPLLHVPKMDSWSNEAKNVVLLGDACHAMNPGLGQGAATAFEDAAFLGQVISEVSRNTISMPEAITLYEQRRIPKAWIKQQLAFIAADIEMGGPAPTFQQRLSGQEIRKLRDASSKPEVTTFLTDIRRQEFPQSYQSWHHAFAVDNNKSLFFYDAEADADNAVCEYLLGKSTIVNERRMATDSLEKKFWSPLFGNSVVGNGREEHAASNGQGGEGTKSVT